MKKTYKRKVQRFKKEIVFAPCNGVTPISETVGWEELAYDGAYEVTKRTWILESSRGDREKFYDFSVMWRSFQPTRQWIDENLHNNNNTGLLYLLMLGIEIGRPITKHSLWDGLGEVNPAYELFREHKIEQTILSFFTIESNRNQISKTRFDLQNARYSKSFAAPWPFRPDLSEGG